MRLDQGWAIHFPKGPHEIVELLWRVHSTTCSFVLVFVVLLVLVSCHSFWRCIVMWRRHKHTSSPGSSKWSFVLWDKTRHPNVKKKKIFGTTNISLEYIHLAWVPAVLSPAHNIWGREVPSGIAPLGHSFALTEAVGTNQIVRAGFIRWWTDDQQ